ncbi:691c807e-1dcb-47b3-902c-71db8c16e003 [Sclerotinia trifoliorum]|uniref:691c807e-1dcb-47b3-902c-71db8c16e003 n=1 Tax=Sclerotinia trifoliorum TaxID=28548 RepID=A0A8H2VVQ9_9HELO|nr:691c807e-1dcb-47b3-902c-71db8c16e003 [Sclerotinia trifoliorum]
MASNGISKNPPTLPPSVEESYKRKCIQLKTRMNEVEEANDAARLRLARMQRAINKMRLERAFLLEQLAKRTSTNVEDSEGSPSPPPTPQEKPLRTKRGHRKPSFLNTLGDPSIPLPNSLNANLAISPSSSAFSHTHPDVPNPGQGTFASFNSSLVHPQPISPRRALSNSTPMGGRTPHSASNSPSIPPSGPPKTPKSGFDFYCQELRGPMLVQHRHDIKQGTVDIDWLLASGWRDTNDETRERYEKLFKAMQNAKKAENGSPLDDDVEMGESGREETPNDNGANGAGGFTAVNRG